MANNVLIIKGADFSANKVETIEIVNNVYYDVDTYLYKNLEWRIKSNGEPPMDHSDNYKGGFVPLADYRGDTIKIENNDDSKTGYIFFIKDVNFETGAFTACTGKSLTSVAIESSLTDTVPSDADYMYVLWYSQGETVDTEVTISIPRD